MLTEDSAAVSVEAESALPEGFAPRVLEIGPLSLMQQAFPATTDFYSTWPEETVSDPAHGQNLVSLANLPVLARRLADPALDLLVVHSLPFAPWTLRALSRTLFRRNPVRSLGALVRGIGPQLLRGKVVAPVAVLDLDDPAVIDRANGFLLDGATVYFKRELPPDHWNVFNGTFHWRVPTGRFRTKAVHWVRIAKLQPLSLGVPFEVFQGALPETLSASEKTTDVFFVGRVEGSSSIRERGLRELLALRQEGYLIDVPEQPLDRAEYLARCARARLVWSPSGYGWQCFRTYEAALCGSVPLLNMPTIEQHQGLREGEHALYYNTEPGGLSQAVRAALQDRQRLETIARAARAHVLAHHTPPAIARYVALTTLQKAGKIALSGCDPSEEKS